MNIKIEEYINLLELFSKYNSICELIIDDGNYIDFKFVHLSDSLKTISGIENHEAKTKENSNNVFFQFDLEYLTKVVANHTKKTVKFFEKDISKWFEVEILPLDRNLIGFVYKDISKQISELEYKTETENYLRAALNSISEGVVGVDMEMKFTGLNPKAEEIFSEKEENLIGESAFVKLDKFENAKKEDLRKVFNKVIVEQKAFRPNTVFKAKYAEKYYTISVSPIVIKKDLVAGVIVSISDISFEIASKNKIRESEVKYRSIFNYAKDAKLTMDTKEFKFLEANDAFYEMFEIDRNTKIKSLNPYLLSPEFQQFGKKAVELIPKMISECLEKGSKHFTWIHKTFNGRKFYTTTMLTKVDLEDSSFIQVTIRDIDEVFKTQQQLIQIKNTLHIRNRISNLFILHEKDMFYAEVLDLLINHYKVEFGLFGYINEDGDMVAPSLTKGIWDKCEVESKSLVFKKVSWAGIWGESLLNKKIIYKNKNLNFPNGHIQLRNSISVPIIFRNKLIGLILLGNRKTDFIEDDIEEFESLANYISPLLSARLEQMRNKKMLIEAKERAEESDKLKSAFLANMSHEIRTPMNGILGFTNLISQMQLSKEEIMTFVSHIKKSGERMLSIINDIMDISKIESNTINLKVSEIIVNDLVNNILDIFESEADEKGIKLIYDKPNNLDQLLINSDRIKIEQVLSNLIKNALKFTEKGFVKTAYYTENNSVVFYVEDSGKGIKKDFQQKIFERFVQEDISLSRQHEGAGLGLSISQAFVEMLGGKIWLESEEGKGSKFYFSIPIG